MCHTLGRLQKGYPTACVVFEFLTEILAYEGTEQTTTIFVNVRTYLLTDQKTIDIGNRQ